MAKNTIYLDVVVDDKGTIKRVAVDAEKVNAAMQKTTATAATADRNLKGAARASSNATKNFSKMAQGISGGIVPAYATLAAQIFALSAAYQFLLKSADFRVMIEGQRALTTTTGLGYESLTRAIQSATEAQLTYNEAAQAAAIGTASGLGAEQLTRLSSVANTVSKTLGRDLVDTFNRLVRGITKAEPELLDELGIILRLKDASEEYARAIGKNVKDLTLYERTQGVYLFTISQAEKKYSAMQGALEPAANGIRQLGVAFTELYNAMLPAISLFSEFIAGALINNIPAAVSAFGLLAGGVLKQLLPTMADFKKSSMESTQALKEGLIQSRNELNKNITNFRRYRVELKGGQEVIKQLNAELAAQRGKDVSRSLKGLMTTADEKVMEAQLARLQVLEKKMLANRQQTVTSMNSAWKGATLEQVQTYRLALEVMIADQTKAMSRMTAGWKLMGASAATAFRTIEVAAKTTYTRIQTLFTGIGAFALRALNFAGWIGILISVGTLAYEAWKWIFNTEEDTVFDAIMERSEDLSKSMENQIKDFQRMAAYADEIAKSTLEARVSYFSKAAQTFNLDELREVQTAIKESTDEIANLQASIKELRISGRSKDQKQDFSPTYDAGAGYAQALDAFMASSTMAEQEEKLIETRKAQKKQVAELALSYSKLHPELSIATAAFEDFIAGQKDFEELRPLFDGIIKHIEAMRAGGAALIAVSEGLTTIRNKLTDASKLTDFEQTYIDLYNVNKEFAALVASYDEAKKKLGSDEERWKAFIDAFAASPAARYKAVIEEGQVLKILKEQVKVRAELVGLAEAMSKEGASFALSQSILETKTATRELRHEYEKLAVFAALWLEEQKKNTVAGEFSEQQKLQAKSYEIEKQRLAILIAQAEIQETIQPNLLQFKQQLKLNEQALQSDEQRLKLHEQFADLSNDDLYNQKQAIANYERSIELERKRLSDTQKAYDELIIDFRTLLSTTTDPDKQKAIRSIIKDYETENALRRDAKQNEIDILGVKQRQAEIQLVINSLKQEEELRKDAYNMAIELLKLETGAQTAVAETTIAYLDQKQIIKGLENSLNAYYNASLAFRKEAESLSGDDRDNKIKQAKAQEASMSIIAKDLVLAEKKLVVLQKQNDELYQMKQNARGALSSALTTGIASVIKDEADDIEEVFRQIIESVLFSMADSLAKMLSDSLMDSLGIGPKQIMKSALIEAGEINARLWEITFKNGAMEIAAAIRSAKETISKNIEAGIVPETKEEKTTRIDSVAKSIDEAIAGAGKQLEVQVDKQKQTNVGLIGALQSWGKNIGTVFNSNASWITKLLSIFNPSSTWVGALVTGLSSLLGAKLDKQWGAAAGAIIGGIIGTKIPKIEPKVIQTEKSKIPEKIEQKTVITKQESTSTSEDITFTAKRIETIPQKIQGVFGGLVDSLKAIFSPSASWIGALTVGLTSLIGAQLGGAQGAIVGAIGGVLANYFLRPKKEEVEEKAPMDTAAIVAAQDRTTAAVQQMAGITPEVTTKVVMPEEKDTSLVREATDATKQAQGWWAKIQETFANPQAGWLEKLGSIFSPAASWIGSLFNGLQSLLTGNTGGTGGLLGSIASAAIGAMAGQGVTKAANGAVFNGGFKAYANGGIATKPTLGMIGEGRYNEAIVPLPDGKSIPVMMEKSSGSQQNNVEVNVNISSSGATSTSVEGMNSQAGALGRAISAAVQSELKRQKRPGGLLSPYGV